MLAVLLLGLGYAMHLLNRTDQFLTKISTPSTPSEPRSALDQDWGLDAVQDEEMDLSVRQLLAARAHEPLRRPEGLSFLLLGIDNRRETRSMNSDVIMAVAVNPNGKSATVVSLPRDMQLKPVGLPERKANFYFPYYYNRDQATAFAQTKQLFANFLDLPIRYTAAVHFRGFEQIVDELGGIHVDVDMNMRYVDRSDGTNINLRKGVQVLQGKQALDFVRYRKSNRNTHESTDYMRNKRQQQVLQQLMARLTSFRGAMHLGGVLEKAGNHIKTDIPETEIRGVMEAMLKLDREQIKFIALRGEWRSPYILVKDEDLQQAKAALRAELSGATAAPAAPASPPAPATTPGAVSIAPPA